MYVCIRRIILTNHMSYTRKRKLYQTQLIITSFRITLFPVASAGA